MTADMTVSLDPSDTPPADVLADVLGEAQRIGFLGDRPVAEVIDDSRAFVDALESIDVGTIVDLGSGGGVPGLVVAADRPDLRVVLIDRRERRTDFLKRAVARLERAGVVARGAVDVWCDDAARVARRSPGIFDGVTARGFGPPDVTLALGSQLVRTGGFVVIAEPPSGDRWPADLLQRTDVDLVRRGRVAVFQRR